MSRYPRAPRGRGVKFGRKLKLSPEQIEKGKRREDVAALLNVDRATIYRALVV